MRKLLICAAVVVFAAASGWGQETLRCESNDMHRHYCAIGANQDVRLVRQHSDAKCIPGRTFGREGDRMWVDRGCRGDFQVIRDYRGQSHDTWRHDRGRDRHGYQGGQTVSMTCSSNDEKYRTCPASGNIWRARLTRQISGSPCIEGRTWGVRGNELWVDKGCRADFEVVLR